ncbi:MAG: D-tyrosyl-tRNA(Tyr) deacylase [SAR324 cluster bacterium]|nr:D-tyrosyl-tRNA(Tyr) deacylase [SAR324 cluster bacterium]
MRILVQKVREARVLVEQQMVGEIGRGLLLFIGITHTDSEAEARYLAEKCINLRIFDGSDGKKNECSVKNEMGEILVVSQFTLYGDCRKGRRPGFDKAADPEKANLLYLYFVKQLRQHGLVVQTGQFQALMAVELVNDGPFTLLLEKEA